MAKRSWNIDSLVLIFTFIIIAQLLSYVIPHGEFAREPYSDDDPRPVVVAGTYDAVAADKKVTLPAWHFLFAVTRGMENAQEIIFLICLFWSSSPSPKSSTPALLLIQVRPVTSRRTSSEMAFSGIPHSPNPPSIRVIPSLTPSRASRASATFFNIIGNACFSSLFQYSGA